MYQQTGNATLTCNRCGISRPTLREGWPRFQADGIHGLNSLSRRPHHSPAQRLTDEHIQWISQLRSQRKLGVRRIQTELQRLYGLSLALATIHKVLKRLQVKPLRPLLRRRRIKRYQKAIPGERFQIDSRKVAKGIVQYTAIDDCTRFMVVGLYPRRTAGNAACFLDQVVDQMPFPIECV